MTGDAIRGMKFPRAWTGYHPGQVDAVLLAMARLLDAGISLPPGTPQRGEFGRVIRGYDSQAVDQFFDALAGDRALQPYPPGPARSWDAGHGEPDSPAGSGTADHQAEWRAVDDLPGTRLRRASDWTNKILDSHGQVLLTCRGNTLKVAASGQVLRHDPARAEIVDAATGVPILRWIGSHRNHHAGTVVLGPGQRWLWFPVQGSRPRNAVMRAVDESGAEVLWFRKTERAVVEAIVSPDCGIGPEILCLIERAAGLIYAYFASDGGGG